VFRLGRRIPLRKPGLNFIITFGIDRLVKILLRYKKQGQFRAFWSAFTDSVNFMVSKEVVIESMWSPAVALVKAAGVNILYAEPRPGTPARQQ